MKIEMIIERKVRPPRYLPMLGWVQDSFWTIQECKKDDVIVEGSHIEAEISTSGGIEPIYGSSRKYPTPPIDRLFLYVDKVLEMFRLISYESIPLDVDKMQLIFEVEKN